MKMRGFQWNGPPCPLRRRIENRVSPMANRPSCHLARAEPAGYDDPGRRMGRPPHPRFRIGASAMRRGNSLGLVTRPGPCAAILLVMVTLPWPTRAVGQEPGERVGTLNVLILSTMLADSKGIGEWGFAALVEADGRRLLFDTGARPETVLKNAEELGVDLARVTEV